jgi:hypothetical protein
MIHQIGKDVFDELVVKFAGQLEVYKNLNMKLRVEGSILVHVV